MMLKDITNEHRKESTFYSNEMYQFHEYADYFPLMNSNEINELSESIKKYGLKEDITLLDGKIIDGRNRYLACHHAGITPRFRSYESDLEPIDFVIIKNLLRRHLNTSQRAEIGLFLLKNEKIKARERQIQTQFKKKEKNQKFDTENKVCYQWLPTNTNHTKGRAINITAKKVRIAPKTLRKAEKIVQLAKKNPVIKEQWEKAKKKELSLEEVYRNAMKIENFTKSIKSENLTRFSDGINRNYITDTFHRESQNYNSYTTKNSLIKNSKKDYTKKLEKHQSNFKGENIAEKEKCIYCSKATVFAVVCNKCGNITQRVICYEDILNGESKLRNPNMRKCKYSS